MSPEKIAPYPVNPDDKSLHAACRWYIAISVENWSAHTHKKQRRKGLRVIFFFFFCRAFAACCGVARIEDTVSDGIVANKSIFAATMLLAMPKTHLHRKLTALSTPNSSTIYKNKACNQNMLLCVRMAYPL